jgi:hypothetical protein
MIEARQFPLDIGDLLLLVSAVAAVLYLGSAVVALVFSPSGLGFFRSFVVKHLAATVGLPCAAVGAFALVVLLLRAFPPATQDGIVTLKLFGFEFTGPAGPVMLWAACFLALVLAIRVLSVRGRWLSNAG